MQHPIQTNSRAGNKHKHQTCNFSQHLSSSPPYGSVFKGPCIYNSAHTVIANMHVIAEKRDLVSDSPAALIVIETWHSV